RGHLRQHVDAGELDVETFIAEVAFLVGDEKADVAGDARRGGLHLLELCVGWSAAQQERRRDSAESHDFHAFSRRQERRNASTLWDDLRRVNALESAERNPEGGMLNPDVHMAATGSNERQPDVRDIIDYADSIGQLARIDGADWNLEIGVLAEIF